MTAIWWIRRDLRLHDNPALHAAVMHGRVVPLFVLDTKLVKSAPDRRMNFLLDGLHSLDHDLRSIGSRLIVRRGDPESILADMVKGWKIDRVFAEEDFTPYSRKRDHAAADAVPLTLVQGQLVHHPMAVRSASGKTYSVYTPFSRAWKALLPPRLKPLPAPESLPFPDLDITSEPFPDFVPDPLFPAGEREALTRLRMFVSGAPHSPLQSYAEMRNRLDSAGTSALSPYFRFGMLSLRTAAAAALDRDEGSGKQEQHSGAQTWLNELIWREFYTGILFHHPRVLEGSFRREYEGIRWQNNEEDFAAWKEGLTGFPVVDAGMRQLRETGWMHNRARMITASFLVKNLLIDWRWGESWFFSQLLDGDPAANNGGWQWTAGVGTDAAPYFRIFNPVLQGKKFDPDGEYVRRWVRDLAGIAGSKVHEPWKLAVPERQYPAPIIDMSISRERALAAYAEARKSTT